MYIIVRMRRRLAAGIIACFVLLAFFGFWLSGRADHSFRWPIRLAAFQQSVVAKMHEAAHVRLVVRSAAVPPYGQEIRRVEITDRSVIDQLADAFNESPLRESQYTSACAEYVSVEVTDRQHRTWVFTIADGVLGYRTVIGDRTAQVSERFVCQLKSVLGNTTATKGNYGE